MLKSIEQILFNSKCAVERDGNRKEMGVEGGRDRGGVGRH